MDIVFLILICLSSLGLLTAYLVLVEQPQQCRRYVEHRAAMEAETLLAYRAKYNKRAHHREAQYWADALKTLKGVNHV